MSNARLRIEEVSTDLDVIERYISLVKVSLDSDSVYIRTKESLEEMFAKNNMNSVDKSAVLSNILGTLTNSLTSTAMQIALDWAHRERTLEFEKVKEAANLELKQEELELAKARRLKEKYEAWAIQANIIRTYGMPQIDSVDDTLVLGLDPEGKMFLEETTINRTNDNLLLQKDQLEAGIRMQHVQAHQIMADTITNYGAWNYDVNELGITGIYERLDDRVVPLSDIQRIIAEEQSKGYAYNAWANAVTASAGMVGTALASDISDANTIENMLNRFISTIDLLSGDSVGIPNIPSTPNPKAPSGP